MYRRPEHVAYALDGDAAILLDLASGEYVGLSAHATRIWQEVLDRGTAEAVTAALVAEYAGADPAVVARDVVTLLDRLADAGLLDRVASAPSSDVGRRERRSGG